MVKTIYADILFLINLIINYLLLFATAHIATLSILRWRLLLAASLGALYAVLPFLPNLVFFNQLPIKLLVAAIIILIAFDKSSFPKAYLTFFASSFAFAGFSLLVSLLIPNSFCSISGGVYYINLSFPVLILSTLIAYLLLRITFSRRNGGKKKICNVKIKNSNGEISLQALIDTGNSLRAPFTNARVVISDYENLKPLLSPDDQDIIRHHKQSGFALALDKLSKSSHFSLVPYKTVGISFSLLLAFTPDEVRIDGSLSRCALCAISESPVSDGSGYNALI